MYEDIIACGSQDRFVYVWSAKNGAMARLGSQNRLIGHLHEVNDVCVSRNHILSTSDDASVLVWQI